MGITTSPTGPVKGTFSVATIRGVKAGQKGRGRARRVVVGEPDARLTPAAGVEAVRELNRALGIAATISDRVDAVAPLKQRRRGLDGGELLVSMACAQLAGVDFMSGLDRRRADAAGQELEPVPTPASGTAAGIAKRFTVEHLLAVEEAIGAINTEWVSRLPALRRAVLLRQATIDGDATDVEVYGRTKDDAAHAYTGALTIRNHIGFWAEAGVPLAAESMNGTGDPRSNCVEVLHRALRALPDGVQQVRTRWDAGYFAADLATACLAQGVQFAIGAKRTKPLVAAAQHVPDHQWVPAVGMIDTEVAVVPYLPGSWPHDAGITCVARRTRIPVEHLPHGRARKRRTIPEGQYQLALQGRIDAVYGYSFFLTDMLPEQAEQPDQAGLRLAELEWWYRHRTDIEALNKDAKHGAAMRHMPSADRRVNRVWMWAALLACAMSSWMQELANIDHGNGRGRRTITRLRRELILTPARLTRRAGTTQLRLPPGPQLLAVVLPRLQSLPSP
ncbi:MAG: transposase [Dermatophilaceae bacterium]|nr:transposase [Propionicimonas sp.]